MRGSSPKVWKPGAASVREGGLGLTPGSALRTLSPPDPTVRRVFFVPSGRRRVRRAEGISPRPSIIRVFVLVNSNNKSSPLAPHGATEPTARPSRWPTKFVLRPENYMAAKKVGFELLSTVVEFEQGHSGADVRRTGP